MFNNVLQCLVNHAKTALPTVRLPMASGTATTPHRSVITQSAEYDKRVANISLFIYIGSPGLHPNSRQAPVYCRQSPGSSHQLCIYIYSYILGNPTPNIYSAVSGESRRYIRIYVIYIYILTHRDGISQQRANRGDGCQISFTV